jgi:hypothetical protein
MKHLQYKSEILKNIPLKHVCIAIEYMQHPDKTFEHTFETPETLET